MDDIQHIIYEPEATRARGRASSDQAGNPDRLTKMPALVKRIFAQTSASGTLRFQRMDKDAT